MKKQVFRATHTSGNKTSISYRKNYNGKEKLSNKAAANQILKEVFNECITTEEKDTINNMNKQTPKEEIESTNKNHKDTGLTLQPSSFFGNPTAGTAPPSQKILICTLL